MKKNVNEFVPVENETTPFDPTANEGNNAIMVMDDNNHFIADLTTRQTTFCSMKVSTPKEQAALFKAMNNPEKRVGDCINMTINAKDLFCEVVTCVNQQTGEAIPCPRIVIIDENSVGYQAVSLGIYSAVRKIIQVFGAPTWETPIPLKVVQITKGDKKLLTFDVDIK